VLTLPPPTVSGENEDWMELVESTVERAFDRWCYAHQHATRAVRMQVRAHLAIAVAAVAWNNYWVLLEEAALIRSRLSGGTNAARRP